MKASSAEARDSRQDHHLADLARTGLLSSQAIQEDLRAVEARIRHMARGAPHPVADAASHLVNAGGKRLRPRVLLIASQLGHGHADGAAAVDLAAAAELVHNASLLHDDVIDEAPTRRGEQTSRMLWGNAHAVLAGDHLMAAALELLERSPVEGVLRTMLTTMRQLVAAEVVQLRHRGVLLPDVERYYKVVEGKTASLFAWCARSGAKAGGVSDALCDTLFAFGRHAGIAFQICDDLLDISGTEQELGKSLFADLDQGVATLPLVLAAEKMPELAELIAERYRSGATTSSAELVEQVREAVHATGAFERTTAMAQDHIAQARDALDPLPAGPIREALESFAQGMLLRRA